MYNYFNIAVFISIFSTTISDIDECADVGVNNCDTDAKCTNTEGSYQCMCNDGYSGDGTVCQGKKRPHVDQNIFQQSTHRRDFYIYFHKRVGIDCFPNVCLSVLSSLKIFHYRALTSKPFDQ